MSHPASDVPEHGPEHEPEHEPEPAPAPRTHDPLAVALANASLLGVGYLMLRRRRSALATVVVTVMLFSFAASVARPWCEIALLLWWAAVIAHGWFLAGGRPKGMRGTRPARTEPAAGGTAAVRRQRIVALGVALPVLLAMGLLRFDASRIGQSVDEARESGDCAGVFTAQESVWFGHRMADAPLTARGDEAVRTCERLRAAEAELATGLTGDTDALKSGFRTLASVLAEPGNEKTVDVVLKGFLTGLPAKNPCHTVTVTDWLRDGMPHHKALNRPSAGAVARTAPEALVGCGDDLMADDEWEKARTHYRQVLEQYPGDELKDEAGKGIEKATLTIELANVRALLEGATSGTRPEYCSNPAKYSGAETYGKGTNRALFFGNDEYTDRLPGKWRTTDAADAVLVVCAEEEDYGTAVRTCPYENKLMPRFPRDVTFHEIEIPVKVYELRTGKPVADRKVEIGGASCPSKLEYTTYGPTDLGPPSKVYVEESRTDVRDGFRSLINR